MQQEGPWAGWPDFGEVMRYFRKNVGLKLPGKSIREACASCSGKQQRISAFFPRKRDKRTKDSSWQSATMALVAKKPARATEFYQQALPMVDHVSPLLRGRIYLGLASSWARIG